MSLAINRKWEMLMQLKNKMQRGEYVDLHSDKEGRYTNRHTAKAWTQYLRTCTKSVK